MLWRENFARISGSGDVPQWRQVTVATGRSGDGPLGDYVRQPIRGRDRYYDAFEAAASYNAFEAAVG